MSAGSPTPDRRFSDLIAVIEATRALQSAGDIPGAMAIFARELTLLFDASACLISTYDPATQLVTDWAAHVIPPATLNVAAEDYALDDYPTTKRVVTELVEVSTAIGDGGDPSEHAFLADMGFSANLLVPLVIGSSACGLVELLDTRPRVFTAEERQFCRLLADQAGIVLAAAQLAETLESQHLATVAALAAALEAKDAYTGGHAQTIAEFAVAVGEELGLSITDLKAVRMGALLHDVGKIGIPEAILNKPGPLTDDEFAVMKRHTAIGADIISGIPGMDEVVSLVRSSHERWDGHGYPAGLAGAEIPRGACVIAVCDAFHAMIEDRVYRKAMSVEGALAELRRCSGTQFMPAAVEALEAVMSRGGRRRVRFTEAA
ncbi:MAG TPA: HD domain-containing phosphohydrolase [Gaiellales bacterium]|jgi:putative nucleotidyltransferase with HDIG domain|nr:HD domain-containing phosphohydrolase [Gaiellales bacterium]